ncbi:calcium-binding protein [Lichenicola cladoniae]|uniref:Calcium-binding protein n=1 Tax=Lichenicola cladoniae TaxID=1484109 RepID=A0A6M8HHK8_9PROT|nr:calcium-binding protein [Lichenicola cladoniae]NPD65224.1 calcium-binding protein [Acetobacteraceae bacterium]QKE88819.1 calcium-binding protein [Lichenicola cladoniae]
MASGGVVTVLGASGHIIPVTVNGSQAYSLAKAYQSAVAGASGSGNFFAAEGNGAGVPTAGGSSVNQYVATVGGTYTYPAGYNHFVTETTSHVLIDASAATAGTTLNTLVGIGGATFISGNESGTFIAGGGNNLFLGSGAGTYTIATSDGNDSIFAGTGSTSIYGGTGNNLISLGSGADTVVSDGTDRILASTGSATISLTGTNSTIYGGSGNLVVDDKAGTGTSLAGGSGNALIVGGTNSFYSLNGTSTVFAGTSDTINAAGDTTVYGAGGTSLTQTGSASLTFIGGVGNATVNSGAGAATVFGANGSNITYTGHGMVIAGSGNETLNGSGSTQGFIGFISNQSTAAGDSISGGSGDDTLVAGIGNQTLSGGAGMNQFIIAANGTAGNASITISDFGSSAGNMVQLYGYGANEVAKTLSTAVVSGSNTTVTLSDKSTITFNNVTNLKSGSFIGDA